MTCPKQYSSFYSGKNVRVFRPQKKLEYQYSSFGIRASRPFSAKQYSSLPLSVSPDRVVIWNLGSGSEIWNLSSKSGAISRIQVPGPEPGTWRVRPSSCTSQLKRRDPRRRIVEVQHTCTSPTQDNAKKSKIGASTNFRVIRISVRITQSSGCWVPGT